MVFQSFAGSHGLLCRKKLRLIKRPPPKTLVGSGNTSFKAMSFTRINSWGGSHRLVPIFQGKVVLEGGCGKGRHTQLAANWGAREVIGVDLSDAVETAFAATRQLENAHIVQADIYHLPLARVFDYAFSIGVLHHLPDPRAGFRSLASKVRAGGTYFGVGLRR